MTALQNVDTAAPAARVHTCHTDMPADLDPGERLAYVAAYGRSVKAFIRKNGAPILSGPVPASGPDRAAVGRELSAMARAHEADRHPGAHRAGLLAVNRLRKRTGADPLPTGTGRKPAARTPRKLAAVPDIAPDPAPVETVDPVTPDPVPVDVVDDTPRTYRTRRDARRELAAAMRARGENPADPAVWSAAKLAAGVK